LRRKANLYCQRATYLARWLDDKKAEAERDWDKLDDAEASDWNGLDDDSHAEIEIEVHEGCVEELGQFRPHLFRRRRVDDDDDADVFPESRNRKSKYKGLFLLSA